MESSPQINSSLIYLFFLLLQPVEEIIDYTAEGTDEAAALENWDSWVNQLESFEKVLADKGLKKDKGKKSKKAAMKAAKEEAAAAAATATSAADSAVTSPTTSTSPMGSIKANRSSIFSSGMSEHRPMSVSDESNRTSMYSTRSSAIFGAELMSVQQGKRRWWNPKRKEATSVYSVSDSLSVSEQDQEKYLASLLQNYQDAPSMSPSSSNDPRVLQSQPDPHQRVTTADVLAVMAAAEERENRERQEALNALLETDGTSRSGVSLSLPLPQVESMTSSTNSTQELASVESPEISVASVVPAATKSNSVEKEEGSTEAEVKGVEEDEDEVVAPMPPKVIKAKAKSTKSKLLPISTPLAQILKMQNPEELWLYVQQAKTYATTRMNKGDKRSAAIALKRAQALEARWQEIMLEMASSEEDDDELLDDDDDDDDDEEEDESEEEEPEIKAVVPKSKDKTVAVTPLVVNKKTAQVAKTTVKVEEEEEEEEKVNSPVTSAPAEVTTIHPVEEEEGEGEDADEERRRMHLRKVTSRSDSAPDMFSKYKVGNKATAGGSSKSTLAALTEEEAAKENNGGDDAVDEMESDGDDDETEGVVKKGKGKGGKSLSSMQDSRLGADATMEQMLETTDKEHLKFYIQRMKTDTVAKARSGSKFAALEGMKNVKVLQQRLTELEEGDGDGDGEEKDREGGAEDGEQVEAVAV